MRLHLIDYVLWLSAPILQLGVLVALYSRRLYRQYPCFFNYTVLQTLSVPVLMFCRGWVNYYYVYFVVMALSTLFSFAVLQDLIKNGFQATGTLARLSAILLASTLVILVAIQTTTTGIHEWVKPDTLMESVFASRRISQVLQIGLLVLLFCFRKSMGISRGSVLYGIALGLGFSSAVNALVMTLVTQHYYFVSRGTWSRINYAAYLLACGVWLAYAVRGSSGQSGYCWKRVVPL